MEEMQQHQGEWFFLHELNVDKVFSTIQRADYLILYYIKVAQEAHPGEKLYLADLAAAMTWDNDSALRDARQQGIERQLFPELTDDEQLIVSTLAKTNDMQINMLAVRTGIPVQRMSALLFSLEMKGVVRMYAGGTYHLLQ